MNRFYRYWWNLKKAVGLLWYWIAVFFVLMIVSVIILNSLNLPDILGSLVGLVLIVGILWKVRASFRKNWPITEEEISEARSPDNSGRGGGGSHGTDGVMSYTCENCGKTLYDEWDISAASEGYTCRTCGNFLNNQKSAGQIYAFGGEVWDDEDDGSNPAPWDDDYGDSAPWDDDDLW